MAGGLLRAFGADPGTGGLLGSLDPDTRQQLGMYGLLAMAGAFGQAAMPSRMPVPIGAVLGAGAGAYGAAMQEGLKNLSAMQLQRAQTQEAMARAGLTQAQIDAYRQDVTDQPPPMYGPGGAGAGTGAGKGAGGGAGAATSSETADDTLPPEVRALLDTISTPEAPGGAYNVRYGGAKGPQYFSDYSFHPNIGETIDSGPNKGDYSTAAGRYQMLGKTWQGLQQQYGFTDFSPKNQDQAAWHLAADTYRTQTGRDLLADLQAGDTSRVGKALAGQWSTLAGAMPGYTANLAKYSGGGGRVPGTQTADAGTASGIASDAVPEAMSDDAAQAFYKYNQTHPRAQVSWAQFRAMPEGQAAGAPPPPAGGPQDAGTAPGATAAPSTPQAPVAPPSGPVGGLLAQGQMVGPGEPSIPRPTGLQPGGLLGPTPPPQQAAPPIALPQPNIPPLVLTGAAGPGGQEPAPAPTVSTPQGMQINPAYIQWAQQRARRDALLGRTTPAYITDAAKLPFAGPTAYATSQANLPAELTKQQQEQDLRRRNEMARLGFAPDGRGGWVRMPNWDAATAATAGAVKGAEATAGLPAAIATEQAKPVFVPGIGLVIPGSMGVGQGSAAAPGAPSGAGPGAVAGQPGVVAPVPGTLDVETYKTLLDDAIKQRTTYQQEGNNATSTITLAQEIGDLMRGTALGWGAEAKQEGGRILAALGMSDKDVQDRWFGVNPSTGDALNKLFLQLSSTAVRGMGAREPGSVIKLFAKAYPNLETQPHAVELMTNALRMNAQWNVDKAAAADRELQTQIQGRGPSGANFRGLYGFDDAFKKSNDPELYWRAAAAMSSEPSIAWRGLTDAQKQQVYDLIPPGSTFQAADGKWYPKPR